MKRADLIVLGNGFDLQCELPTSYLSYFKFKLENNDSVKKFLKQFDGLDFSNRSRWFGMPRNEIIKMEKLNKNFTVWDAMFLLLYRKYSSLDQRWCDIETLMLSSLCSDEYLGLFDWNAVFTTINACKHTPNKMLHNVVVNNSKYEETIAHWLPVCEEFQKYDSKYNDIDGEIFLKFLLDQLKLFEENFSSYIKSISNNEKYKSDAASLLQKIKGNKNEYIIDSFNYTKFDDVTRNIHGSPYNGEPIIFGFDDLKISINSSLHQFTKTSRKFELRLYQNENTPSWDNYDFDDVYIYGHSLSQADYSYFFKLFDRIKLYEPNNMTSKLFFCYSIYCKESSKEIKDEVISNTKELINTYSKVKEYKGKLLSDIVMCDKVIFKEI